MATVVIKKQTKAIPQFLPQGWKADIMRTVGCSDKTVYNALHKNMKGIVSEKVRNYFAEKYGNSDSNENK